MMAESLDGLALARRVALLPAPEPEPATPVAVPPSLLAGVRDALLAGDTHYTSRPGMPALRAHIASALARLGAPAFDPEQGVVVTSSERESLFVVLLANQRLRGLACTLETTPHQALFHFMGWGLGRCGDSISPDTRLVYREAGVPPAEHQRALRSIEASGVIDVLNVSVRLARAEALPPIMAERTLVIGSGDGWPGQEAFGTGFVAGPASLMNAIRTWKQAFSICTAAPAQRAALLAFAQREGAA